MKAIQNFEFTYQYRHLMVNAWQLLSLRIVQKGDCNILDYTRILIQTHLIFRSVKRKIKILQDKDFIKPIMFKAIIGCYLKESYLEAKITLAGMAIMIDIFKFYEWTLLYLRDCIPVFLGIRYLSVQWNLKKLDNRFGPGTVRYSQFSLYLRSKVIMNSLM